MTRSIIQWGSGAVGRHSLRYVLGHPELELVGLRCYTADKSGRDAGDIVDRSTVGVAATLEVEELLAIEADCVLFMPRDGTLDPTVPGSPSAAWVEEVVPILASGKNVVSCITSAVHWRHLADGEGLRARLDEACATGGTSILFTGVDPGFVSDCLAITMASLVGEIEQVRTWEMIDYSCYPAASVVAELGFGKRPGELPPSAARMLLGGWGGAPHLVADALGLVLDDLALDLDVSLATTAYVAPNGLRIDAGTISALRWSLSGVVDGSAKVVVNHINRFGPQTAPEWASMGTDGGYRVEIVGSPPFHGHFPLGLPGGFGSSLEDALAMTAARCVNAVDTVVRARPGYHTVNDLPMIGPRYGLAPP